MDLGKVVNTLDHATCGVGASAGSLCNRKQKKLGSSAMAESPILEQETPTRQVLEQM